MTSRPSSSDAGEPRFFITGGTLPLDAASYVSRQADRDLYDALLSGELCYVLDTRQMGKSSLMIRTAQALRKKGVRTAVLDLTGVGQNVTPERWYAGLLTMFGEQLDIEDAVLDRWRQQRELGGLQRFLDCLRYGVAQFTRDGGRVVVFVDEIDVIRSLPFCADEFFGGIRECYNRRRRRESADEPLSRLTFCLLGVATPADLVRDVRLSPFNIGRRIELTDFTPTEAAPLAAALGPNGNALLQRILHWTNGHPYLTQLLCRAVASRRSETLLWGKGPLPPNTTDSAAVVDDFCESLLLAHGARERDDNLTFVRHRLLGAAAAGETGPGADTATLLDRYRTVLEARAPVPALETDPLCAVLRLSGITRVDSRGNLIVRNRIYARVFDRQWIQENLPDAERRRQRAAYRRGLFRAATAWGGAAVVTSAFAAAALWQAREARRHEYAATAQFTRFAAAEGIRLQEAGDPAAAMVPLTQALRRDERYFPERVAASRLRYQFAADRVPHPRLVITTQGPLRWAGFGPPGSGRRAAVWTAAESGVLGVWDAQDGHLLWKLSLPAGVYSVAFSPDGTRAAVACDNGTVQVIRTTDGDRVLPPLLHWTAPAPAYGIRPRVAWSRDGRRLAVAGYPGTSLWDATTGREISRVWHEEYGHWTQRKCPTPLIPLGADFSPDGRRVVIALQGFIAHYADVATGHMQNALAPCWTANGVRFSPRGNQVLLMGSSSGKTPAQVWRGGGLYDAAVPPRKRQAPLPLRHGEIVTDGEFSADGRCVATASQDGTACVWDTENGKPIAPLLRQRLAITCVRFDPSGRRLVTASRDGIARIWDARTGAALSPLLRHASPLATASFRVDGQCLLTASGGDGKVYLWDSGVWRRPVHPQPILPFPLDGTFQNTWALSAGFDYLRVGQRTGPMSPRGSLLLSHIVTGKPPAALPPGGQWLELSAGAHRASTWDGRRVCLYEIPTGKLAATLPEQFGKVVSFMTEDVYGHWVAVTPPGRKTFAYNTDTGREVAFNPQTQVFVPSGEGRALPRSSLTGGIPWRYGAASDTYMLLLTEAGLGPAANKDRLSRAFVWERATGRVVPLLLPMYGLQEGATSPVAGFTADGKRLVTGGSDCSVYDIAAGKRLVRYGRPGILVTQITTSRDGERMAVVGDDSTVQIFDSRSGRPQTAPLPHPGPVAFCDFSADGRLLATGCTDRNVRLWDAHTGEAVLPTLPVDQDLSCLFFATDHRYLGLILRTGAREWPYRLRLF